MELYLPSMADRKMAGWRLQFDGLQTVVLPIRVRENFPGAGGADSVTGG